MADKALAISPEALDALIVRATVEWLNEKPGTEWVARLEKINPNYGEGYAIAAAIFVINRRYEEGIALYRKALGKNPDLLQAKAEGSWAKQGVLVLAILAVAVASYLIFAVSARGGMLPAWV